MRRVARLAFALTLVCYPRRFRARFGAAMADDFADRVAARRSPWSAASLLARGLADSIASGLKERRGHRTAASGAGSARPADLVEDTRTAIRSLIRNRPVSAWSILTLALAFTATIVMLAIVDAALLRPLDLPDPDALVAVHEFRSSDPTSEAFTSDQNFADWRRALRSFSAIAMMRAQTVNVTGLDTPDRVRGAFVSGGFFDVTGVRPVLGRALRDEDDVAGAAPVAVIDDGTWQRWFGGAPSAIGRVVSLNNLPFTVVGIMPPDFSFPVDGARVWLPAHFYTGGHGRAARVFEVFGRLRPGVGIKAAGAELNGVVDALATMYPGPNTGWRAAVEPLRERVAGGLAQPLAGVFALTLLLLAAACMSVSSLQIGMGAARRREIAIRTALGAARGRLVGQYLIEQLLIAGVGGAVGLAAAAALLPLIVRSAPVAIFGLDRAAVDGRVALATIGLAAVCGIASALLPAFRWTRAAGDLATSLRAGGRATGDRGTARVRAGLVTLQTTLAALLLSSGVLLARNYLTLLRTEPGFDASHKLTLEYRLPANKYTSPASQAQFHDECVARVRAVPGVTGAAVVRALPFSGNGDTVQFLRGDALPSAAPQTADLNTVSDDYFRVMHIPVVWGRTFAIEDRADAPLVVVVNEAFAAAAWPSEDPVGREVTFPGTPMKARIIGIVGDSHHRDLADRVLPGIYARNAQNPGLFMTLVADVDGDPMAMLPSVRRAIWSLDPDQPVWKDRTLQSLVDDSLRPSRFFSAILMMVAGGALLLVIGGLYGVVSQTVTQRSREIALRVVIGAAPSAVLRLVIWQGLVLGVIGLSIAWPVSLAAGRVVGRVLGTTGSAGDAFVIAAPIVILVAAAASYWPARRATAIDATSILRD